MYDDFNKQPQEQQPQQPQEELNHGFYHTAQYGPQQRAPETHTQWDGQGGYHYSSGPQSQQHYYAPPTPPKKPRESSHLSRRGAAVLIAAALVLSLGCGFGGGVLAGHYFGGNTKVIYQAPAASGTGSSGSAAAGSQMTVAQIAELASQSVVEITTEEVATSQWMQQYISEGAGSGVIITRDGYIVTNNHVIEGASRISVRTKDGTTYEAELVGTDAKTDIAVIRIEASGLQPAVFGDSSALQVGELAVAIGNPLGQLGGTVTDGIISALDREITIDGENMNLLQTSAAINPGNSGGGLFNGNGELVGIVNAKSSGSGIEGLGFAIPINTAREVAQQLMENGYVQGRVELGVTLVDITDAQTAMMYRVQRLGVYVLKVNEGSAAEKAGFRAGDCIVTLENKAISSYADVKTILDQHEVGDELSAVVLRGSESLTLQLTLGEYKPAGAKS